MYANSYRNDTKIRDVVLYYSRLFTPIIGIECASLAIQTLNTVTLIANTHRLLLRHIAPSDAAFYRQLVNEPAWIANIGDRQVHSLGDARQQITGKLMASYAQHGFGMYLVALNATGHAIGICGLVKRDTLPHPDIGFAFLQGYWGQGYALEAAGAVLDHAFGKLNLGQVLGITLESNKSSADLLIKLGLRYQGEVQLGDETRNLYRVDVRDMPEGVALRVISPG